MSLDSEFDSRQVHADIMIGESPDDCNIRFANQFGEPKLVNESLLENNSTEITAPQFSSALQSPLVQNSNLYHEDWSIRYRKEFLSPKSSTALSVHTIGTHSPTWSIRSLSYDIDEMN